MASGKVPVSAAAGGADPGSKARGFFELSSSSPPPAAGCPTDFLLFDDMLMVAYCAYCTVAWVRYCPLALQPQSEKRRDCDCGGGEAIVVRLRG